MKYLILFIFIVLSGCKSEKEKFYEETGIYLFDCDKSKPNDCYLNDWKICKSGTKKIDKYTKLTACYNTALRDKKHLENRIKIVKERQNVVYDYDIYTQVNDYLKHGIRTCYNTIVFKNDSIKYFCEDFEKHYENICLHNLHKNYLFCKSLDNNFNWF